MVSSLDANTIVDIGFMLFVTVACAKSLLQSDDPRARWKQELLDLHTVLKSLISEATSASQHLDRNLMRRQEDLKDLLSQIDRAQIRANQSSAEDPYHDHDVPNESWLDNPTPKPVPKSTIPAAKNKIATYESLNQQIEVEARPKPKPVPLFTPDEERRLRLIDASALRVGKRLLASGKEIHIVARKLELSIPDTRLIDRIVRAEQGLPPRSEIEVLEDESPLAGPAQFEPLTLNNNPTQATVSKSAIDQEWYIDREQVLL